MRDIGIVGCGILARTRPLGDNEIKPAEQGPGSFVAHVVGNGHESDAAMAVSSMSERESGRDLSSAGTVERGMWDDRRLGPGKPDRR